MDKIKFLKELLDNLGIKASSKDREMKRVFQWRRYLEWNDLTKEEKLGAKRILFVPIVAYFVFSFINQYAVTVVFLICLYFAYKKFDNGKLSK